MALKTRYSPLQHFSMENLYNSFVGLTPPNKIVALAVSGLLAVLVLFLPLSLASGKIGSMRSRIANAEKSYEDVVRQVGRYQELQEELGELEKRIGKGAGSLTSKVESIARESGIGISQLKEKPFTETDFLEVSGVDLQLKGVTLQQVVDFLYALEEDRSTVLRVKKIQMKPRFSNRQLLDVSCEVASFEVREGI